jgi:hypothetical protein
VSKRDAWRDTRLSDWQMEAFVDAIHAENRIREIHQNITIIFPSSDENSPVRFDISSQLSNPSLERPFLCFDSYREISGGGIPTELSSFQYGLSYVSFDSFQETAKKGSRIFFFCEYFDIFFAIYSFQANDAQLQPLCAAHHFQSVARVTPEKAFLH